MVVKNIFENYPVSSFEVAYGLLLGTAVTAMLGYQAFAYEHSDYTVDFDLRLVVFVAHVACLVFVTGAAVKFNGVKAVWAHLTIGSGIFATLAVQSAANALMLAFIIADLRLHHEYNVL